jgi:hypothetical protein
MSWFSGLVCVDTFPPQAREAEIRAEVDARDKRPPGRPPRFASPVAKRRRRGAAASSDGEEEEEEEDPVEDAGGWLFCFGKSMHAGCPYWAAAAGVG